MSDVAAAPASEANNDTSISISRRSSVDPAQYATLVIRCYGCQTHVPVPLAHVMTTYSSNKRLRVVCSKRECGAVVCHSTTAGIQASSSLPVNWRLNRVSPSDERNERARFSVTSLSIVSNDDFDSVNGNPPSEAAASFEDLHGRGSYNEYIQPMRPPGPDHPSDHFGFQSIGEQFTPLGHRHSSSIISLESSLGLGPGRRDSTGGHSIASNSSLGGSSALPPNTRATSPGRSSMRAMAIYNRSQTFTQVVVGESSSTGEASNTPAPSSPPWGFQGPGSTANPATTTSHSGQPDVHTPSPEESNTPDPERMERTPDVGINTEVTSQPPSSRSTVESPPGPAMQEWPNAATESPPRKRDQLKALAKRGLAKVRKAVRKIWPSQKHKKANQAGVQPALTANGNPQPHDDNEGVVTEALPRVDNAARPSPQPAQQAVPTAVVDEGNSPPPLTSSTSSVSLSPSPQVIGEGVISSETNEHLEQQIRAVAAQVMQPTGEPVVLTMRLTTPGRAAGNA